MGLLPGADLWVERAIEQLRRRRDELVSQGEAGPRAGRGGPRHRGHGARDPRRRGRRGGGRPALEEPGQRERQAPGFLGHPARAVPQRGMRVGRGRKPMAELMSLVHAAPRGRAPPGRAGASRSPPTSSGRWWPTWSRSGPRARATWPSCWTSPTSGTTCRCGWRPRPASTPGPLRR